MRLSEIVKESTYEIDGGGAKKSWYVKNSETHKVISDRNLTKADAEETCAKYEEEHKEKSKEPKE